MGLQFNQKKKKLTQAEAKKFEKQRKNKSIPPPAANVEAST